MFHHKEIKEATQLTFELANHIHQQHTILQNRTANAIYERLPYLDNLLAGVFKKITMQ